MRGPSAAVPRVLYRCSVALRSRPRVPRLWPSASQLALALLHVQVFCTKIKRSNSAIAMDVLKRNNDVNETSELKHGWRRCARLISCACFFTLTIFCRATCDEHRRLYSLSCPATWHGECRSPARERRVALGLSAVGGSAPRPPSCRSLYRRVWACRAPLARSDLHRRGAARGALAVGPVVFCFRLCCSPRLASSGLMRVRVCPAGQHN